MEERAQHQEHQHVSWSLQLVHFNTACADISEFYWVTCQKVLYKKIPQILTSEWVKMSWSLGMKREGQSYHKDLQCLMLQPCPILAFHLGPTSGEVWDSGQRLDCGGAWENTTTFFPPIRLLLAGIYILSMISHDLLISYQYQTHLMAQIPTTEMPSGIASFVGTCRHLFLAFTTAITVQSQNNCQAPGTVVMKTITLQI